MPRVSVLAGLLTCLIVVMALAAQPRHDGIAPAEPDRAGESVVDPLVWSARSTEIAVTYGAAVPRPGVSVQVIVSASDQLADEAGRCTIPAGWVTSSCVVHGLADHTTYLIHVVEVDDAGVETAVTAPIAVTTTGLSIGSSITSQRQADVVRADIVSTVFGSDTPLQDVAVTESTDICAAAPEFLYCAAPFEGVARIDLLRVGMAFGAESLVAVLEPRRARGSVVYHRGHEGVETPNFQSTISALVQAGFSVAIVSMPLFPPNSPALVLPSGRFGDLQVNTHDDFAFLEDRDGPGPLQLFLQPAMVAVDHFAERPGPLGMIGLSGGGWTTTMVAALDPRVGVSVAVAGSVTFAYRVGVTENRGDWEQRLPRLAATIDYTDLYLLATTDGRTAYVVSHDDDPCCFASGGGSRAWERELSEVASRWGGRLEFPHLVASTHDIQPETVALFLKSLRLSM